jgi:uncharacterized protein YeaO (DUF488 family)
MIKLKRAYDRASRDDGVRYLVERLWPRDIKNRGFSWTGGSRRWPPVPSSGVVRS